MKPNLSHNKIFELISSHGLEPLGIVELKPEKSFLFFKKWIQNKKHAFMHYLEKNHTIRQNPQNIDPKFNKAIIIGFSYCLNESRIKPKLPIAQYARFKDYHKFLKKNLTSIMDQFLSEDHDKKYSYRITVDSAPILERALAARTSKGFIGKNTMYIHPTKGSFLLLCEILTNIPFTVDAPSFVDPTIRKKNVGGCGSCTRCQTHCPTGALNQAYQIDARKCLAYYTIEHRDIVPVEYWKHFTKSIFGCDICQIVCPYNKDIKTTDSLYLKITTLPPLKEIVFMSQKEYILYFSGTPMTRAKRSGLRRNALIALIASNHPDLDQILKDLRDDEDPLVQKTIAQIPVFNKHTHTQ